VSSTETPVHPLVGGWRLRTWVAIAEDGTESRPMGEAPAGLLAYTADGTMVAMMGRGDRQGFAGSDITGGTERERADAFSSFIAYGGHYEVDGGVVVHRVETSLFPNSIGTDQRREWQLDPSGRSLTLTSPPIEVGGTTRIQRLSWERVVMGSAND
jgi:hypothetical protein